MDEPALVPYTTPRVVTASPPSAEIVPPLTAEEDVRDDAAVVDEMVGVFNVVKLVCAP